MAGFLPACLFFLLCRCALQARSETLLERTADQILLHKARDGALTMEPASLSLTNVEPYFGNQAALGLVCAYRKTHKPAYNEAVRRWVRWYEAHADADGIIFDYKGAPGAWQSTGKGDSIDSYAATYLTLVWEAYRSLPDLTWLRARAAGVHNALAAIRRLLQPDGLTIVKPTYPVMYTMDNVEVLLGLRAAAHIEQKLENRQEASDTIKIADDAEAAITHDLWDPQRQCYRIGIQTDGGKMEGLKDWYPDIMANLMAIAWLPSSARNRALFHRLQDQVRAQIPTSIQTAEDLERVAWWGLAAQGAGDASFAVKMQDLHSASASSVSRFDRLGLCGLLCCFEAELPSSAD